MLTEPSQQQVGLQHTVCGLLQEVAHVCFKPEKSKVDGEAIRLRVSWLITCKNLMLQNQIQPTVKFCCTLALFAQCIFKIMFILP